MFDDDNSGAMDFAEYMLAINATNLNTPQAFLCFIFSILIFSWFTLCRKNLIGEGFKKKKECCPSFDGGWGSEEVKSLYAIMLQMC